MRASGCGLLDSDTGKGKREKGKMPSASPKTVMDRFRLDGKVALVTGGARGLGKTMATALAQAGADIALSGRSQDACRQAAAEIAGATGRRVGAFSADVTKSSMPAISSLQ